MYDPFMYNINYKMSSKIDEIIEKLKQISLLEASELVKKILRI